MAGHTRRDFDSMSHSLYVGIKWDCGDIPVIDPMLAVRRPRRPRCVDEMITGDPTTDTVPFRKGSETNICDGDEISQIVFRSKQAL
jgi:hypothetical protein